jgi:LIVCS family branched-chain amino acid:cation transporter
MQKSKLIAVGLAIFAMLFGAGNVVFPLALGRDVGDNILFALLGFCTSGVLIPVLGLVAGIMFDGDYKRFLATMGRIPGFIVALICMILLGLFLAPRCITLSYAAVKWYFPDLSLFVFSLFAVILIFVATVRKNNVVGLLGRFLGPIKLSLLFSVIVLGILYPSAPRSVAMLSYEVFFKGLKQGYLTMDLLATIFFSGLIISSIKHYNKGKEISSNQVAWLGLQAGIIGGLLLGVVYTGFCIVASMYSFQVIDVPADQLLSALATLILGPKAAVLANLTVAVACLTTAIALTTVFADYLCNDLFGGKIQYLYSLLATLFAVLVISNLGFSGIGRIVGPLAELFYPALIVLCLANIAKKLFKFEYIKTAVFTTFIINLLLQVIPF